MTTTITSYIKKNLTVIIATVVYFITCIFLFFLEYQVYGKAVETDAIVLIVFPIVMLIGWLLRDEKTEEKQENLVLKKLEQ
jgi:Na+/melibiose symporter-like transporter